MNSSQVENKRLPRSNYPESQRPRASSVSGRDQIRPEKTQSQPPIRPVYSQTSGHTRIGHYLRMEKESSRGNFSDLVTRGDQGTIRPLNGSSPATANHTMESRGATQFATSQSARRSSTGNHNKRLQWTSAEGQLGEDDSSHPAIRPDGTVRVPLHGPAPEGQIEFANRNGRISLVVRGAPLNAVLDVIAQQHGLNIISAGPTDVPISVTLNNVDLDNALNSILAVAGLTWSRNNNIVIISPITKELHLSPQVQGRQMRVFPLNFVAASDVQQVVVGLLSPVGQSFVTESTPTDKKRTRETLVVEDLPEYLLRVEQYICQADQPPRQVLIEAHLLQVDLEDDTRHGVNFEYIAQVAGADVTLTTTGFANPASSPAFFLGIDGTDLDALVEAIKMTTDAKTLASPKVLVLNGQEARIQIGERFGYLVTTTTQTATVENVDFLDVGVVLTVTPQISDDNQVLMTVRPEVSSGRINLITGLPEEETTEVDTTVMLPDGHGIVIGGLIQENDTDRQSKIPVFGDLWLVGKLFQQRNVVRERTEIVIALVPRIVPYGPDYEPHDHSQFDRATTRLFNGPLIRNPRPEPVLPDAMRNPRRLHLDRLPDAVPNLFEPYPLPLEYYLPAVSEETMWLPPPFYPHEGQPYGQGWHEISEMPLEPERTHIEVPYEGSTNGYPARHDRIVP